MKISWANKKKSKKYQNLPKYRLFNWITW